METVLNLVWLVLPAYLANGSPVVLAKFLRKRHPMDFGLKFIDGRRLLGESKSWEGFVFGVLIGTLCGVLQGLLTSKVVLYTIRGLILGLGAMLGDVLGSFIKRRLGIKPGDPLPLIDQTLFIIVAVVMAQSLGLVDIPIYDLVSIVGITFFLHITTNVIAYLLKLKDVPW